MKDCDSQNRFSQDDIIEFCTHATGAAVLGGAPYGNIVVKLIDRIVVKFGVGVTADEARNQVKAYEMTDRNVLRVPRVYSYFRDSYGRGYIVMELLNGETEDPLTNEVHLLAVSGLLEYFATFYADKPGPLGGGSSRALIFGDADEPMFTTIDSMEEWFNQRLFQPDEKVSLRDFPCVLCHLDLFPRNLIWKEGEAPGVLDWASAGFYPRLFKVCSHFVVGDDTEDFSRKLFSRLPETSENESTHIDLILRVWRNIQRFSFPVPNDIDNCSSLLDLLGGAKEPPPPLPPYPEEWLEELKLQAMLRSESEPVGGPGL